MTELSEWLDSLMVIIPVATSLYAGASLIGHSERLRLERKSRTHIKEFVNEFYPELMGLDKDRARLEAKLKQYYRLPEKRKPTRYLDLDVEYEMSDVPLSGYQIINQYVLLGGASIAVILLATKSLLT